MDDNAAVTQTDLMDSIYQDMGYEDEAPAPESDPSLDMDPSSDEVAPESVEEAPAPGPESAPAPAPPSTPAPAPASAEPAPDLAAHRAAYLDHLTEQYKLDEDTVNGIWSDPGTHLPRLLAQVRLDATESAFSTIRQFLPQILKDPAIVSQLAPDLVAHQQAQQSQQETWNTFLAENPHLNDPGLLSGPHSAILQKSIQAVMDRPDVEDIPPETQRQMVAEMATRALSRVGYKFKKPAPSSPKQPAQPSPAHRPPVVPRPGASVPKAVTPQSDDPMDDILDDLVRQYNPPRK